MIISGIAAAISGALFAGSALATSLIGGALTFGLQLGMKYLNRPKKQKYAAVQGEVQFGADVPVGTLFGTGLVAGHRWFYAKWGSGNKVNADVFGLANGWCDGLEPYVYFYGEKHNLVVRDPIGGEAAHYGIEGFGNRVSIRFYDGRPGQPADMKLVNDTANLGKTWKATSVAAGMAYVVVERTFNADLFDKGRPEFEWVLRGLRLYDPRKDSTVAGGSGPHRLGDDATYEHSLNPAVQRLNYQLGLRGLISGRTMVGEGKSIGQLDLGTYFAAMNVCDSLRNGKPTYQSSIWVDGEMDHTEILKEFDDAMAGYALNRRGLSGVIPGAPQIPVLEITGDDIPVDRAKDVQLRKSAFDLYNYISGQFTSIESMWKPESLTPVYVNADIAADGRCRQTANDFLQVTDPDIAQYLLNIRYRQNRKGGTATVPVSRRVGLAVQEGEWVTFRGKTWLVTEWQVDEQFRFTLKLAETGADIYDDGDIEPGPIVIPPTQPINPSLLSTVQNFNVEAGFITGVEGYDVPVLQFTWTPPDDPTITAVRFFYRVDGTTEEFQDQTPDPETGKYITTKNVVSGKVYIARATITTVPDRLKTFTPWVTTANPTGLLTSPFNGVIGFDRLAEDIAGYQEWLGSGVREIRERMEEIDSLLADQDFGNALDRQKLREQVTATFEGARAEYMREVQVLATADAALATRIESLTATVGVNKAEFLSQVQVLVNADTALSQSINSLSTNFGSFQSSVNSRLVALSDADEALALSVDELEAQVFDPATGLPAVASAVSGLQSQVSTIDGRVTSLATALTSVTAASSSGDVNTANFRMAAMSGPSGYSRIGAQARQGGAGSWRAAAWYLDVPNNTALPTRFLVEADQFIVVAGGNLNNPFVVDGTAVRMNVANIGTVNAGRLLAPNGKVDFNLNAGTLEFYS